MAINLTKFADLQGSDYHANDYHFVTSCYGRRVAVGAAWKWSTNAGEVYVYDVDEASNVTEEANLTASDGAASDIFGFALSLWENTLAVGAPYQDYGAFNSGSVYIFNDSSGWAQTEIIRNPNPELGSIFGAVVLLRGDYLLVSAPLADVSMSDDNGKLYVYKRVGGFFGPTPVQTIITSTFPLPLSGGNFGSSLSFDGTRLAVGEPGGIWYTGAVHVYNFDELGPTPFVFDERLVPTVPVTRQRFGNAVSIDNDLLIIGACGTAGASYDYPIGYIFRDSGGFSEEFLINKSAPSTAGGCDVLIIKGTEKEVAVFTNPLLNNGTIWALSYDNDLSTWVDEENTDGWFTLQDLGMQLSYVSRANIGVGDKDRLGVGTNYDTENKAYLYTMDTLFPTPHIPPFITNEDPDINATGVDGYTDISVDILGSYGIYQWSVDGYVNGELAFSGPDTFYAPYDGESSSIVPISEDGYDGYRLVLDCTEMLPPSTTYTIRILASDAYNSLDESYRFRTGIGIVSIEPILYEITLDVTFTDIIANTSANLSSANYMFNHGMYARYVQRISDTVVRLWVELFQDYEEFSFSTINVTDSYGNSIPSSYNTKTFGPFQSGAMITNFDGKVRSWHESKYISADTKRVYLAGTKGIDVLNRQSLTSTTTTKWAQIFDSYGIESMYVAHFGGDFTFHDTDPPYISYANPAAESEADPDTNITFIISDDTTNINAIDIEVYINAELAFLGRTGGWVNGYSGIVLTRHKRLSVLITPPVPYNDGDEVNVRVVAEDLFGNELDTSYKFYVVVVEGYFGVSEFGTSYYGGSDFEELDPGIFGDGFFGVSVVE